MSWRNKKENWREEVAETFDYKVIEDSTFPCVIPASPNWYCSGNLHCRNGYAVIGAKWSVYLMNLQQKPPVIEGHILGSAGYNCKVTAVHLCELEGLKDPTMLPSHSAVGMDDGLVRIVNCATKTIFKEHRKHQVKVSVIVWSDLNEMVVLSGDDKGTLAIWNLDKNLIDVWIPIKSAVLCCEFSPRTSGVAVIGYANGNVLLCNTQTLASIHVFKAHSDEIWSVSWAPNLFKDKDCFVTGSKDKMLHVWDIEVEKSIVYLSMPKVGSKKKNELQKTRVPLSVCWLNEKKIVFAHPTGQLISWDLDNNNWNQLGKGHSGVVFAISLDPLTNQFLSICADRKLIVWNGGTLQSAHVLPTIGGFAYSLTSTPLDPHSIGIGSGDAQIHVWNTAVTQNAYAHTVFRKIKTKVMVVEYHPTREGILGFGTEDGHIGLYSCITQKHELATTYHRKSVYSLKWGPDCKTIQTDEEELRINFVYSCGGEGTIFMHKMGAFNQEAVNVSALLREQNKGKAAPHSDVCWRPDYKLVAIGHEDGSIEVLTRSLKLVCRVLLHKKIVNTMEWHHNYAQDSGMNLANWLASGSDDHNVYVTDITQSILPDYKSQLIENGALSENEESENEVCGKSETLVITTPRCHFGYHTDRITQVSWSPHQNGMLAIASFDGSVQIYNALSNEQVGNYRGHVARVYAVLWSFVEPGVVYSGGDDFTVRRWKVAKLTHTKPPGKKIKSRGKKNKQKQPVENIPKQEAVVEEVIEKPTEVVQTPIKQPHVNIVPAPGQKDGERKKKRMKSLLKKSSVADSRRKQDMQNDCLKLAQYLKAEKECTGTGSTAAGILPGSEEHPNLGLYASRKDAFTLLKTECDGHENSMEQLLQLEVWRSNFEEVIEKATQNNQLNDTMVAMSPIGGYETWRRCMVAYANQLRDRNQYNLAVLYYLAVGEIYQAIDTFKNNGLLKEALLLAKTQLSQKDPIVKELYLLWAKRLIDENNLENAAECYIAVGDIDTAITTITKRGDSSSLFTAIKLADMHGLKRRSEEYLHCCVEMLIEEQKWSTCQPLLPRMPTQLQQLRCSVNELLVHYLNATPDLVVIDDTERLVTKQDCCKEKCFVEHVHSVISSHGNLDNNELDISSLCQDINNVPPTFQSIIKTVSDHLLAGILLKSRSKSFESLQAWSTSFRLLTTRGYHQLLDPLFRLLFPHSLKSFPTEHCEAFVNITSFRDLGRLYARWWSKDSNTDANEYYTEITNFKASLLAEDRLAFHSLDKRLQNIECALVEADIKARLEQHVRAKSTQSKKMEDVVKSILGEIVNKVCNDVSDLRFQKSLLEEERNGLSRYVKEMSFACPQESAHVLNWICSHETNNPRFTVFKNELESLMLKYDIFL